MSRGRLRALVLEILAEAQAEGRTWREVSEILRFRHLSEGGHGPVSGVLSTLDRAGSVVRLAEKRDRCSVYVLSGYVENRRVAKPRTLSSNSAWLLGYDAGVDETTERLTKADATRPDLVKVHQEGVAEGRRLAQQELLQYVEVLLIEGSKGQPAYVHTKTCWRQHPMCALLAVKKKLTLIGV